jgi:hypothetical protein
MLASATVIEPSFAFFSSLLPRVSNRHPTQKPKIKGTEPQEICPPYTSSASKGVHLPRMQTPHGTGGKGDVCTTSFQERSSLTLHKPYIEERQKYRAADSARETPDGT